MKEHKRAKLVKLGREFVAKLKCKHTAYANGRERVPWNIQLFMLATGNMPRWLNDWYSITIQPITVGSTSYLNLVIDIYEFHPP